MSYVELPALWFDFVQTQQIADLNLANTVPEADSTGASKSTTIYFELLNTINTNAVNQSSLDIWVTEGTGPTVLVVDDGVAQGSWARTLTPIGQGGRDLRVLLTPPADFGSEALITVRVVAEVTGGAASIDETYSFTIEDFVIPELSTVVAIAAKTIRVTFNEGMTASDPTGTNDALNPANYIVAFQQLDDKQAGVEITVSSVAQVDSATYDLTTDIELSFWRTYLLTVVNIADDSGNAISASSDSMTFESWTPPGWPANRRFNIWSDMMANDDRTGDIHNDLERLLSIFQDTVDLLLWDVDRFDELWDIDNAPEIFIRALLQDLGNPHLFDLTELQFRKLVDILVASYKQHGTEDAIINLARFFLELEVSISSYNQDFWVLGVDELGIGTELGPAAGTPELYTFVVYSPIILTQDQERDLSRIIEVVKVAHEHYIITDPSDAPVYEPWEIGVSLLGDDTFLH